MRFVEVALVGGVGRADVGVRRVLEGHDEDAASIAGHVEYRGDVGRQIESRATLRCTPLAGVMRCDAVCSAMVNTSSAHTPGRVDDGPRGDRERRVRRATSCTIDGVHASRGVVEDVDAAHVGRDVRAEVERRGLGERERDACVVAAGVEVEEARDESIGVERR